MSNLNAKSAQLQGTLYIGFPKTFSGAHMETLFEEISDFIDNSADLTLADLQAQSNFAELQFQQQRPSLDEKNNFFFMDMDIYISTLSDSFGQGTAKDVDEDVSSINVFGKDLEDVCILMAQNGYSYDRLDNCWSHSLS